MSLEPVHTAHAHPSSCARLPEPPAVFLKYQDRILYGTDSAWCPFRTPATMPTDAQRDAFAARLEAQYRLDWAYYAGTAPLDDNQVRVDALGLPRDVLEKVYWKNAERLIGVR